MEQTSAIYEPMIPMGWIGSEPVGRYIGWELGRELPPDWCDVVVSRRLDCGIAVTTQRRGLTVYDFTEWTPGVPQFLRRPGRLFPTFGESSEAAKPALVQRLRVINTHLTLLHAATLVLDGQSPIVIRVNERDLLRLEYPDDGGDAYWFLPLGGGLPTAVTVNDSRRHLILSITACDRALEWLDAVVAADALIVFDLLNQTQAAVSTHDYALAVVAAWTICELRTRAAAAGLPGVSASSTARSVCNALAHAALVPSSVVTRLHTIRERRNAWLHSGAEPVEAEALEAMELATVLLRDVVPDLTIRTTSDLLML